jgi:Ohr subfamily peroxiredoxin
MQSNAIIKSNFSNYKDLIMSTIQKVLVTGKTHTIASDAGGNSRNHDGNLDITLTVPGNSAAQEYVYAAVQAHPTAEQLFAGAWSACYFGAVGFAAKAQKVALPSTTSVDIEVDLVLKDGEYLLQARLTLNVPGIEQEIANAIAHAAHAMCPYSKMAKGIDVVTNVVTA